MAPKFSVLDLTLDQVASIEKATGIPFGKWGEDDTPRGDLNRLIAEAITGKPAGHMTFRQMVEMQSDEEDDSER